MLSESMLRIPIPKAKSIHKGVEGGCQNGKHAEAASWVCLSYLKQHMNNKMETFFRTQREDLTRRVACT